MPEYAAEDMTMPADLIAGKDKPALRQVLSIIRAVVPEKMEPHELRGLRAVVAVGMVAVEQDDLVDSRAVSLPVCLQKQGPPADIKQQEPVVEFARNIVVAVAVEISCLRTAVESFFCKIRWNGKLHVGIADDAGLCIFHFRFLSAFSVFFRPNLMKLRFYCIAQGSFPVNSRINKMHRDVLDIVHKHRFFVTDRTETG